jgi:hypothetical protein
MFCRDTPYSFNPKRGPPARVKTACGAWGSGPCLADEIVEGWAPPPLEGIFGAASPGDDAGINPFPPVTGGTEMLTTKIRTLLISSVAVAAIAVPATASAALRGGLSFKPPVAVKSTAVALEAFPTGKGTVDELETCDGWTHILQADQQAVNNAVEQNSLKDYLSAKDELASDYNGALDAGCGVID